MSGMTITPTGKLIQKIHCQAKPSAMAPPATGPAMVASPVTALNIPSALARSSRGNAALKSAIERHDQRCAGTLHRTGDDQRADVACQCARRRGHDEQGETSREHAP